ncbi:MSC_0882 family membrane protein [Mycoplasmopsis adleri]|uniref:MSC_0882 family membrane protein n=1 Tax=Mycoplasmopsis adleri TaxID=51362 RepID=UPI003873852E
MQYRPIQNAGTVEIVEQNRELESATKSSKVHQDPKHQFSPRIYRVIRSEKMLKITLMTLFFSIALFSIIAFVLAFFKIAPFKSETSAPLYGYLVLFGTVAFISIAVGIKNAIENVQWSHTVQRYRDAISAGDYTSSTTFHIVYRKIILKDINLLWILIFILTYLGLFTLIIFGLYKSGSWEAGNPNGSFHINLDWRQILDKGFGNTQLFCLISVIIMASLIAGYIIIKLFDKKRLADISDFLGERSVEIQEQIEKDKKDRNKMWLRIYLVVVILTILLPLALVLVAIWRGFLRRKKDK